MTIPFVKDYLSKTSVRLKRLKLKAAEDAQYHGFTGLTGDTNTIAKGGVSSPSSQAQPYIINVVNTTGVVKNNFVLFNANQLAGDFNNFHSGNYIINGVKVSSGLPNVTYQALVNQSQTQPFTIGTTLVSANNVNAQVQQAIVVSTTDASGVTEGVPVPLLKDPYQSQSDMVVVETDYQIDGTTAITISSILGHADFDIYFYPSQSINPSNQLAGQSVLVDSPKPEIIRDQTPSVYMGG